MGELGPHDRPDRNSPLTQITRGNVNRLGRVYQVDFRQGQQRVRLGMRSYPLVVGRRMYVTTNENSVWALDAPTGRIIWRYEPDNFALFANFGIVANRGRRVLRRPAVPRHARHAPRRAASERRQGAARRPDRQGRSGRLGELRLRADEHSDLRQGRPRDGRGWIRVRDPRVRHGLAHVGPEPGLAEPVLDDPARADRVAEPATASSAAARSGPRSRSTRRRTRSTSAPARRRRSTCPSSVRARRRGPIR